MTADVVKHTPGPWEFGKKRCWLFRDNLKADGNFSSSTILKIDDEAFRPSEEDAHLIAAAPDLLAALKDSAIMVARLKRQLRIVDNAGYTHDGRMLSLTCVEDATDAAIAKAEGRS